MTEFYFAYGSNMSTPRMRARVSAARAVATARLGGHRLVCDKRGADGSGKANLRADARSFAWGVVFEIPRDEWPTLDRYELAYARHICQLTTREGRPLAAQLYLAIEPVTEALPPFDWYRAHMLDGAREHRLPGHVIEEIESWVVSYDPRSVALDQT